MEIQTHYVISRGAAVCAVRRAGGMNTVNTMNNVMLFREMFLVGSTYWNMVYGKDIGDVLIDDEGIANMRNIGQNMAYQAVMKIWTLCQ